jgi:hypothetical protein
MNAIPNPVVVGRQELVEKPFHGIAEQDWQMPLDQAMGVELDKNPLGLSENMNVGASPKPKPIESWGGLRGKAAVLDLGHRKASPPTAPIDHEWPLEENGKRE